MNGSKPEIDLNPAPGTRTKGLKYKLKLKIERVSLQINWMANTEMFRGSGDNRKKTIRTLFIWDPFDTSNHFFINYTFLTFFQTLYLYLSNPWFWNKVSGSRAGSDDFRRLIRLERFSDDAILQLLSKCISPEEGCIYFGSHSDGGGHFLHSN